MPDRHDATRHTPARLAAALNLAREHWGATDLPFFIGGGGQCDVYGFKVPATALTDATNLFQALNEVRISKQALQEEPKTQKICLRIPRATVPFTEASRLIHDEAAWRAKLAAKAITGVQRMIHYDTTSSNALGSSYIALEWAEGKPLCWNDSTPVNEVDRQKVIRQVVQMSMAMLRIREEGCSARAYMQKLIDNQISLISNPEEHKSAKVLTPKAIQGVHNFATSIMDLTTATAMHLTQTALLDKHIIPSLNHSSHVLIHGDLGPGNIIIDADHNVTLIDLGYMHMEPLQLAAYYPRFLTHEPSSVDEDCPFDGRLEGKCCEKGWGRQDTKQMGKDRAWYLSCVRDCAAELGKKADGTVDEELVKVMRDYLKVLEDPGEMERFWWMVAMQRVDVWLMLEKCGWEPGHGKADESANVDVEAAHEDVNADVIAGAQADIDVKGKLKPKETRKENTDPSADAKQKEKQEFAVAGVKKNKVDADGGTNGVGDAGARRCDAM